jgi:hypothetical protein
LIEDMLSAAEVDNPTCANASDDDAVYTEAEVDRLMDRVLDMAEDAMAEVRRESVKQGADADDEE